MGNEVVEKFIKMNQSECSNFLKERAINPWKHISSTFNETDDYLKVPKQICSL